jgi:xylan 1,4-beta-xylosidase
MRPLSAVFIAAAALIAGSSLASMATAQTTGNTSGAPAGRTWANPVDLDYKYSFEQTHQGISYRTGGDPTIVLHRDRYYLFQTGGDGYWTSRNLVDWAYVVPDRWPFGAGVAPAAASDDDGLYLMQSSTEPKPLLVSIDPTRAVWDYLTRVMPPIPGAVAKGETPGAGQVPAGPWAPDLFIDNDGKWYIYWGSSDVAPLYGSEINPVPPMEWVDTPRPFFTLDPDHHGWERFGQDHSGGLPDGTPVKPFLDGAWMARAGGRYYLQYAAPGTGYNASATGLYVGASPLGPFDYAPYSPISYKPGGFVNGAGHGSSFQDRYGNWWNSGASWVGVNWSFERRIALYPGAIHPDGQMWFSSRFGDFPQRAPDGPVTDPDSLFTGWMPLSYRAKATASSTLEDFAADRATDEDPRTFWVAADSNAGQTLTLDLGALKTVQAVQVNYADYKSDIFAELPGLRTRFRILWSTDGQTWSTFASRMNSERDSPNAYVQGERPVRARYVRYEHGEAPGAHLAIADFRVFGTAAGAAPAAPANIVVKRGEDQRNAIVTFDAVPNPAGGRILGYNVRWGVKRDRLHLTYQVWADDLAARGGSVEIRALNTGVDYAFAVEAFGDTGVSPLSVVLDVPAGDPATVREPDPPFTGLPQPFDPGKPPATGTVTTPIPPVYISGAPPVIGAPLPATGNPAPPTTGPAAGPTTSPTPGAATAPATPPPPSTAPKPKDE